MACWPARVFEWVRGGGCEARPAPYRGWLSDKGLKALRTTAPVLATPSLGLFNAVDKGAEVSAYPYPHYPAAPQARLQLSTSTQPPNMLN